MAWLVNNWRQGLISVPCMAVILAALPHAFADDRPPLNKFTANVKRLGFVPGDAFFPVEIEDTLSFLNTISDFTGQLDSGDPKPVGLELDCQFPDSLAPEQYKFGFSRIRVLNVTWEDADILDALANFTIFEQEQMDLDEGRSPWRGYKQDSSAYSIIIVNKNFDFDLARPYVRYNEDWNEEQPNFWPGDRKFIEPTDPPSPFFVDDLRDRLWPRFYQPHVISAEAVLEDWVNGPKVPPLKVQLPKTLTREKMGERKVSEPVEIDFREVAFVGFPTSDLRRIFTRPLNSTFYVATTEGLHRYRWVLANNKAIEVVLDKELIEKREEPDEE